MQRPCRIHFYFALVLSLIAVAGCGSGPNGSRQPALHSAPTQPAAQAGPQMAEVTTQGGPSSAEVRRLITRLDALETDNEQLKRQLSDQYMQTVRLRQAQLEARNSPPAGQTPPPADANTATNQGRVDSTSGGGEPDLASASRLALLDTLVAKIIDGKDPARTKALMVAALSVASQRHELDHALLDELDPRSREQVARFHQMMAVAYDELAGDAKRELTRREMIAKIDEVFGAQPLQIDALELCRRVDSYGVYEPFASTRFLAGRKNRVLIYVELENFHHEPTEDGKFEVRLEQQVELYDATGETTVWRQGPVELVDVSRNKRRDFFIVYPIDLPARLTAGGYRLKVRIADKHTGSICEQTIHDIKIVADRALVGAER